MGVAIPSNILNFLKSNSLAMVATISTRSNYPHVACVFYYVDDKSHIYFATRAESEKAKHIALHPHVGIAITDAPRLLTLRIEGNASIMNAEGTIAHLENLLHIANQGSAFAFPPIMKLTDGTIRIVEVIIKKYSLSDFSREKVTYVEGTFTKKNS